LLPLSLLLDVEASHSSTLRLAAFDAADVLKIVGSRTMISVRKKKVDIC
jgi:hypothetical protein